MNSGNGGQRGKTQGLVVLVIATNVLGNVFLSRGMHQVGRIVSFFAGGVSTGFCESLRDCWNSDSHSLDALGSGATQPRGFELCSASYSERVRPGGTGRPLLPA